MLQNFEGILEEIKFKPLDRDRIVIGVDRLTRFKETESKYLRVFKDILINNLISPKYKKSEIDEMDYSVLKDIAEHIINSSLEILVPNAAQDLVINKRLAEYEKTLFKLNPEVEKLLDNKINYSAVIKIIPDNPPINLKWLIMLSKSGNPEADSFLHALHFPIKKLVICEGITEEILLPEFARILDYDFDKYGVHLISAGGKNQVVRMFYKFAEILKIPIFILLDSDAAKNYNEILPRLRSGDKIYILEHGEFEDILPSALIEKTLAYSIANISSTPREDFDRSGGMVHYLEEYFRHRGVHEFKKADFAQALKLNIAGPEDVSDEFKNIISVLRAM